MEKKYYLQEESNDKQNNSSFDINHAVDQVANMYDKYVNLKQVQESHITRRREIKKEERLSLKELENRRNNMKDYLEGIFKERSQQSDKWFKELDKAIETNNLEMIDRSCRAIVDLGRSNPLSHIAKIEQTRKFIESDEEIDL